MTRRGALLALPVLAALGKAQTGLRDRYFIRYPFDRWAVEGEKAQLRWTVRLRPAKLSVHQRLLSRIEIELDSKEVGARRSRGELVTLLQVEDSSGRRWRAHDVFDFTQLPQDAKPHSLTHFQDAFLVPGDYFISIAITDSKTGEYSFTRRPIHVPALRNDPLPAAWEGLPSIEFVRVLDIPDSWFQPNVHGRLHLTAGNTRVDVLMNITAPSVRAFRHNMSVLVPALKILAGIDGAGGSVGLGLFDLNRRMFQEQPPARALDWPKLRPAFAQSQPGVIDAQSLAARRETVTYFRETIGSRLRTAENAGSPRALIVLSAPAFLGPQLPAETAAQPNPPHTKVFYLRYRALPARSPIPDPNPDAAARPLANALPADDLEHALKPFEPRVLTAETPETFRKALAAMLLAIQRM
jgi:hypothetical protein